MERKALKSKIIRSAIQRHNDVMDQYQSRIEQLRKLEPAKDKKIGSSKAYNSSAMMRLLQNHLLFINEEMNILYNIENNADTNNEIKPGSIVVTDKGTFFISVFVDSFVQDGKDISCVSENSPFYFQIEGKKCGDQFFYNNSSYKILEIY